jgi:hypothetical protein
LVAAVDNGVVEELKNSTAGSDNTMRVSRLAKQLEDDGGMRSDLARWAVESFAGLFDLKFKADEQPGRGTDGKAQKPPVFDSHGNEIKCKYDNYGNVVERAYFGPVLNTDGYARATWIYDEWGKVIEVAYFGTDGWPVLSKYGHARATHKYDKQGRIIEVAYFGVDGQPMPSVGGTLSAPLGIDTILRWIFNTLDKIFKWGFNNLDIYKTIRWFLDILDDRSNRWNRAVYPGCVVWGGAAIMLVILLAKGCSK